jgi:pimeloyl-ACP methyl ester carboxylesterase
MRRLKIVLDQAFVSILMSTTSRNLQINGIGVHINTAGAGPLVICCHGWPELAYSWRHQIPALAQAGFRVAVPDMRGFGGTDAPSDAMHYSILHLVGDIVGLVHALGERQAYVVGHDWGAQVAWNCAMLRPDVFPKVVAMSVPHRPRAPAPPIAILRKQGLDNFYWCYFQTPGVAEAEFERDVDTTLRKIIYGIAGDAADRDNPLLVPEGGGFLDGWRVKERLPAWLTETDLAVFVAEYRRTGFRGGLNWYRNIDRNWELTAPWHGAVIEQPALFIAGTRDPVIAGKRGAAAIEAMLKAVPNLRQVMLEGSGHWIQQERPAEVNGALLDFLM